MTKKENKGNFIGQVGQLEVGDILIGQFAGSPSNEVVRVTKTTATLDDGSVVDREVLGHNGIYQVHLRRKFLGDIRTWKIRQLY